MNLKDQKKITLDRLKKDKSLSLELKDSFEKQISDMNEDEFAFFIESLNDAKKDENLEETILKLKETEQSAHNDFMKESGEFSRKVTKNQIQEDEVRSRQKSDSILNKIKKL